MSYDIALVDKETKRVLKVEEKHHLRGGTYQVGGCQELSLNITYNYSQYYYKYIDSEKGIRAIYGLTGEESIPILEKAASMLRGTPTDDYWEPTEGNAKAALLDLIALAKMRPDGVWEGD